jgi:hypothetical protein
MEYQEVLELVKKALEESRNDTSAPFTYLSHLGTVEYVGTNIANLYPRLEEGREDKPIVSVTYWDDYYSVVTDPLFALMGEEDYGMLKVEGEGIDELYTAIMGYMCPFEDFVSDGAVIELYDEQADEWIDFQCELVSIKFKESEGNRYGVITVTLSNELDPKQTITLSTLDGGAIVSDIEPFRVPKIHQLPEEVEEVIEYPTMVLEPSNRITVSDGVSGYILWDYCRNDEWQDVIDVEGDGDKVIEGMRAGFEIDDIDWDESLVSFTGSLKVRYQEQIYRTDFESRVIYCGDGSNEVDMFNCELDLVRDGED